MRHRQHPQLGFGQTPIEDIEIDFNSRDDIPKILLGLQHLHAQAEHRDAILGLIERDFAETAKIDTGARGMDLWQVLVLGVMRLGLDIDYDRLAELANQHRGLRQMLGHGDMDWGQTYGVSTLGENLSRLRPDTLQLINWTIVKSAHAVLGVDEAVALRGRCDSAVVKTDVHYPTDANLLLDAVRKILRLGARAAKDLPELSGWRESEANYRKFKNLYGRTIRLKRSTSKDESKKAAKDEEVREAFLVLLETADSHIRLAEKSLPVLRQARPETAGEIEYFIFHARRQSAQIRARVIRGERIPHGEKTFSLFEPHTEWIVKGKAGVPVELGIRTAILEDQHGLILNHRVMENQTDDKITLDFTRETQVLFPQLRAVSFDKGFYSPKNRERLEPLLEQLTLPKKGRLSEADLERETAEGFVQARKQHPAVESAFHALQTHGLSRCRDHGLDGFKRYVAWGIAAYNLHKLGAILLAKEQARREREARRAA
jgi:IS5 family transposase